MYVILCVCVCVCVCDVCVCTSLCVLCVYADSRVWICEGSEASSRATGAE